MNGLIVRASTEADVARCAEIYGHHVLYGTASFEETPPDLAEMKKILKEIQTGKFVKEWVKEYKGGLKNYNKLLKAGEKHQIEKTGAYLRGMMPWMKKKNIKGVAAAY